MTTSLPKPTKTNGFRWFYESRASPNQEMLRFSLISCLQSLQKSKKAEVFFDFMSPKPSKTKKYLGFLWFYGSKAAQNQQNIQTCQATQQTTSKHHKQHHNSPTHFQKHSEAYPPNTNNARQPSKNKTHKHIFKHLNASKNI